MSEQSEERYLPLDHLPKEMIPKNSDMIPNGQKIRLRELLLGIQSINDNKGTVTFTIEGVFPPAGFEAPASPNN